MLVLEPMSASCSSRGSKGGAIVGEGKAGVGRMARPGATIGPAVGTGVDIGVGVSVGVNVGVEVGSGVEVGTGDAVGVAVRVGLGTGDREGVGLGGTGVGSGCEQVASRSSRTIGRGKNLTVTPLFAGCPP